MSYTTSYFVAVYIDILGQKDELCKIEAIPKGALEREAFKKAMKRSISKVERLRDDFNTFIEKFKERTKLDVTKLSDENRTLFEKMRVTHFKTIQFSDTLVMYFPLDENINITPLGSIFSAITTTASIMMLSLEDGTPLRGAISVGVGADLASGGLYGPLLSELHRLESKDAKYPRIIISKKIFQALDFFERRYSARTDMLANFERGLLSHIKSHIKNDYDGIAILDYMGLPYDEALTKSQRKVIYQRILSFVEGKIDEYANPASKNEKLLPRYKALKKYISKSKSNWVK